MGSPPVKRVFALHPGIAGNALLRHAGRAPIHRFLVGTLFHAFLVAPAPVLVNQDDPVLRPFVNGLPRTGSQTARIRAVVTDPLQIEEVRLMLRQAAAGHLPGLFLREAGFIEAFHNGPHRRRRIFINIHKPPFLVRGNVANGGLADLRPGIKNGHALEHAIGRMVFPARPGRSTPALRD